MMQWGNGGWGMGFGWIFMIFFWVLVILGVVYLVQIAMRSGKGPGQKEMPLDILKKRYAKDEMARQKRRKPAAQ